MRKVLLGAMMLAGGAISCAILMAAAIRPELSFSVFDNLSACGLMPAFFTFAALAVAGLLVAIVGLFGKH